MTRRLRIHLNTNGLNLNPLFILLSFFFLSFLSAQWFDCWLGREIKKKKNMLIIIRYWTYWRSLNPLDGPLSNRLLVLMLRNQNNVCIGALIIHLKFSAFLCARFTSFYSLLITSVFFSRNQFLIEK